MRDTQMGAEKMWNGTVMQVTLGSRGLPTMMTWIGVSRKNSEKKCRSIATKSLCVSDLPVSIS